MSNATSAARYADAFFNRSLADSDPEVFGSIQSELGRQRHEIELIASENIVSRAVLEAQGSVMTNKYAEGYPGKRYYGGCQFVDIAEELAIERAKKLFGCHFANVQPNSGSQMTTTTHKSLRGPRGGMILTNDEAMAKKINSAVFPGLQGGPLMHVIAAKAVAFGEALTPEFKTYANNVADNAKTLAASLKSTGLDIVSGGTDNHLMLVDLRPKNATGKKAEGALGRANITCNKNGIPFDPEKPFVTSGIRLGTPAGTTRGFGADEFTEIGNLIAEVLDGLKSANSEEGNATVEAAVKAKVISLTDRFPLYPYLG